MNLQAPLNIFLSFLLLFLSTQTSSQTYIPEKIKFKRLTFQEGFPSINISYMLQDRMGFLWIATSDGLIRFDGKKQKLFRYSSKNENSIGSNTVVFIYEDRSGVLWFATPGGGLNKYNSSEESFTRYTHNSNDPTSISSNEVFSIVEDKEGIFWIGTYRGGLNRFDPKSGKFSCYKNNASDNHSLSSNTVSVVYEDSKGTIWVGTRGGGLNRFDREKQNFIRFIHNPSDQNSLSNNNITGIIEDNNGSLWISTMGGGLNKLIFRNGYQNPVFVHFKNNPNDEYSLSNNEINKLYIDRENEIWIGTWGGGLNRMISISEDNSSVKFISYKHDPLDIFTLTDNNIECIYEDNSGLLWVSTSGDGLHIYDKNRKPFKLYVNEPNNPNSLGYTSIWSVYEDKEGTRWIGLGDGGLNKMIKGTEKFIRYTHNPKDPYSISDNSVSTIYEDKFNTLWVGTWNGGLNKFDRKTGRFYKYKHDPQNPKSISDNRIFTIIEDTSENLWIGTRYGGLNKFNRADESFTHYRHNPDDSGSLSSDYASELYCDRNGNLLIATFIGLDVFDPKNEKFIHLNLTENNYPPNKDIRVTAIRESKSGILWLGIMDMGLVKYDLKEGVKKTYSTEDGLPVNYITGILEDDHENLWVSTTIGVSKFNPTTETFKTYTSEDGIQGMNESKPVKSKTGEMLFSGAMGLSIFHPDSIKDNTDIPPVYITDFYLFNKPVQIGFDSLLERTILNKSIILTDKIELNHDENVITFEFAALDYHAPAKNKYAYKMEGFDKNWTYTDAKNAYATYTNLDPGEYIFRVKGSNNDGYWNEKGASIKLIILPPWWSTDFAYIVYLLLLIGLIYGTWKTQIRRIKNKHEYEMKRFEAQKLHEVDELKSRFFTNISHEFRTPLTLILGPAKDILESTQESKTKQNVSLIKRNAGKLLMLVNQLLDISKIESGNLKLQTKPLNIVPLVKGLVLSFSSYAERKRIKLKFIATQNEIIVYLDIEKFEKIITNILSNALKFTPEGGRVEVKIASSKSPPKEETYKESSSALSIEWAIGKDCKYVEISVSDTGIGMPADRIDKIFDRFYQVDGSHTREHEGTGIGLSLTKELIELHKGKIEVESEPGKGSTFTVSLPLGKDHLSAEEICEESLSQTLSKGEGFSEINFPDEATTEKEDIDLFGERDKPILLIVEDNPDVRIYIKENLKDDFRILEAADGEDGLKKAIQYIPELIVSDIMMPKLSGFKLCEKIKTNEVTSHIPVILLTAKAAKEDKLSGYELGADEYLMKPFDTDELKSRIKNLIIQRKRLQEHSRIKGFTEIDTLKITPVDKKFLEKCVEIINQHISDSEFSVDLFAEELSLSHSGLQKKILSLTGETPSDLLRKIRLNKAAELIKNKFGNISEIALEVGYNNPAHFSEAFKKQFGVTPSQYQQNYRTP